MINEFAVFLSVRVVCLTPDSLDSLLFPFCCSRMGDHADSRARGSGSAVILFVCSCKLVLAPASDTLSVSVCDTICRKGYKGN